MQKDESKSELFKNKKNTLKLDKFIMRKDIN
jgi:hypothetical protein